MIFKNLSKDADAIIKIKNGEMFTVDKSSCRTVEINGDSITFSVAYKSKDFTFGFKDSEFKHSVTNIATDKLSCSIDKAILQLKNTYNISGLTDATVIEINDRAHYVDVSPIQLFFRCIPALYYFGAVECIGSKIQVISSQAVNRESFLKFYKWLFRLMNFYGIIFNVIGYKIQLNRHKKISDDNVLTQSFQKFYSLPFDERDYQFKPLNMIFDNVVTVIKEKLSEKMLSKIAKKIFVKKK